MMSTRSGERGVRVRWTHVDGIKPHEDVHTCVFHVDRMWTSTRGGVWLMWTEDQKSEFFVDVTKGWPLVK